MNPELVITRDGSHSLYRPDLDEQYHSAFGAIQESRHIYIQSGFEAISKSHIQIFELGFGSGLNVLLTWLKSAEQQKEVKYYSIEKFPLSREITSQLNYPSLLSRNSAEIFLKIHNSEWEKDVEINHLILHKVHADILNYTIPAGNDLIYFDAFSPDKEPQLWSKQVFKNIYASMNSEGVFVTYSCKGEVRRNLLSAGFSVEKLSGPPGKKQILRAVK